MLFRIYCRHNNGLRICLVDLYLESSSCFRSTRCKKVMRRTRQLSFKIIKWVRMFSSWSNMPKMLVELLLYFILSWTQFTNILIWWERAAIWVNSVRNLLARNLRKSEKDSKITKIFVKNTRSRLKKGKLKCRTRWILTLSHLSKRMDISSSLMGVKNVQ